MLGKALSDPYGIEGGTPGEYEGLGLLDISTTYEKRQKTTRRVSAQIADKAPILHRAAGKRIRAYEIHMGESKLGNDADPIFKVFPGESEDFHFDGLASRDGLVFGSYLHGLFDDTWLTNAVLEYLAERKGMEVPKVRRGVEASWEGSLELLAKTLRDNVDLPRIFRITGLAMSRRQKQ